MASEYRTLVKNTLILAGSRGVQAIGGIIRSKVAALTLGVYGVGILDQLIFLSNKFTQLATVGTSEAFVKQTVVLAGESDDALNTELSSVIKSYVFVVSLFLLFFISGIFVFRESINSFVFGDNVEMKFFKSALLALPVLVLQSIPFSLLKSFKEVKLISKARVISSVILLLVGVPFMFYLLLDGVIIYVLLSAIVELYFFYFFIRKKILKKYRITIISVWNAKMRSSNLKELFVFSSFGLTVGVYQVFSEISTRGIVVDLIGIDALGTYAPVLLFSTLFTGFVLPSLATYLYPRFSEIKKNEELTSLINDALRISFFSVIPILFLLVPFNDYFIELVFTAEFSECSKYIPLHMLGVLFQVVWFVNAQVLTPKGLIKLHGILKMLFLTLDLVVTYFVTLKYGLWGMTLKYVVSPFLFYLVYSFINKVKFGVYLYRKNTIMFLYILLFYLVVLVLYHLDYVILSRVISIFSIMSVYFLLDNREKEFIQRIIKR